MHYIACLDQVSAEMDALLQSASTGSFVRKGGQVRITRLAEHRAGKSSPDLSYRQAWSEMYA